MSIRYALFANGLTSDVNDYSAHVEEAGMADLDVVFNRVVEQGERLNETDARSVMYKVLTACESLLLEGRRVDLAASTGLG